jgi:hypothetical protein
LWGAFVWARRPLNRRKRWFPARAGRIPKATFGVGLGYPASGQGPTGRGSWCCFPSDLELWVLNAAARYVLVTRDWGFLAEPVATAWGELPMVGIRGRAVIRH